MGMPKEHFGPGRQIRTSPETFLSEIKPACSHLFQRLREYELLADAGMGLLAFDRDSDEFRKCMQALETFQASDFARGVLAGSILQIAFTGIDIFSRNKIIPEDCQAILNRDSKKAMAFCIGRRVPDKETIESYAAESGAQQLPMGLVVYAARNQYCHWHDIQSLIETKEEPVNKVVEAVFDVLVRDYWGHPDLDLAFDLGHPWVSPIHGYWIVRSVLRWHNYESFLADMKPVLSERMETPRPEEG